MPHPDRVQVRNIVVFPALRFLLYFPVWSIDGTLANDTVLQDQPAELRRRHFQEIIRAFSLVEVVARASDIQATHRVTVTVIDGTKRESIVICNKKWADFEYLAPAIEAVGTASE
jgi:hypothetical protein